MSEPNVEEVVTYLSAKFNKIFYDREFISCVSNDFLKLKNKNNKCCVLVFPALGPVYQRALKYQARAFDLATFGLTGGTFRIIAVCQKEYMLNENKQGIAEEKEMSSELLHSARDVTSRKKRPERQLYIPPAQRKLASSKDAKYENKNCKVLESCTTNEAMKPKIEIREIEPKKLGNEKELREKYTCKKVQKYEKLDHLEYIEEGNMKKVNIDEFAARILSLHDLMHLNLLPLPNYSCNISYNIDRNSLSLKNFHECSCEFYKYLISKCENKLEYYIPIYHLSDIKFMQFLIDNYLCWQPLSTDNLINVDEIIENNCGIPFFNYIRNADDGDFLKNNLNNGLTLNQIKLFMKIKTCEKSENSRIIVNTVSDASEAESIFNEDLNICYLLKIVCDNEPFDNIVDLTDFSLGHYFRVPKLDGCEYFHVCDEIHDTQKCYMEVKQKITSENASTTRHGLLDKIEFKTEDCQVQNNKENGKICEKHEILVKHINNPDPKLITNVEDPKKSNDSKNKCKHEEEKEIMRKTKENINRKTRPLMKYSDDSDNLLKIDKQDNVNNWEDLFDDNGQIQEELLTEIVHKVGKDMTIVKASEDYTPYMQKPSEDLEHVVEIYNFPPSLSTGDIIHAFSMFDSDSMYIVWVDDTHALLVLGSSSQAQRAMELNNPLIKVRPMSDASAGAMAMASQYDLKPAMKRPQTNLQTARRLITNHLGTRSQVTKEQTAKEREHLRKAREQRKITRQNEKDAWEGNVRSSLR